MKRSLPARSAAAAVLAAGALSVTLAAAGPAAAAAAPAPRPQTTGCSAWAVVAHTKMHVRECAGLSGTTLKETIYIKNSGHAAKKASGQFVVSWGQAGNGAGFAPVRVAAGHTRVLTHVFRGVPKHATFTVAAGITVAGHASPTVHTKIVH